MESQKYVIRELFLIEFVKQISIHAGKLMPIPIEEPKIEISRKQELKKIITVPLGKQLPRRPLQRPVQRLMPMQQMQKSTPTQQRMQRSRQITTPTKNISQMPSTLSRKPLMVKGMAPKQTSLTPSFVGLGLGKLSMFLSDPAIIALECQGPGIPITANRAGIMQKTNILLNETKIKNNPEIGKPMKHNRKGTREVYLPPFRLSYAYNKTSDIIIILDFYHKDAQ